MIAEIDVFVLLRRLRKKLRQIENLEQLSRPLNEEEQIKVSKKEEIRNQILELSKEKNEHVATLIDVSNEDVDETTREEDDKNLVESGVDNQLSCEWKNQVFVVHTLNGHNDIITRVAADEDLIVSCSRDTTVKVWDANTRQEVCSLRGHTGSVTCIDLLTPDDSEKLLWYMGSHVKCRVAITGSVDCMVKIWMLSKGQAFKSFYTYNEINSIGYIPSHRFIVTGTEGGKLELWNAVTSQNLCSVTSYGDAFTNIKISDKYVYTSSAEGFVSVWELQEEELKILFSSEKLFINDNSPQIPRKIRCLELVGDLIYFGDDGLNVKILDWKNGKIKKLPNNMCTFGSTDAICSTGKEILFSCYNLDLGYGSINARSLPKHQYLTSLGNGETGRIFSIASTRTKSGKLRIVTAGMELKVWNAIGSKFPRETKPDVECIKTNPIKGNKSKVVDSEMESSETDTNVSDSDEAWEPGSRTYIPREITPRRSIFSWCSIL